MRRIVATEYVTLDGVMQDPGGAEKATFTPGGWTIPYWSDEIGKAQFDSLMAGDALLLGRLTYEGFAKAWPSMKDDAGFADRMNGLPKYVASKTLTQLAWTNSHLLAGDVVDAVSKLKLEAGQDILIYGSARLVQSLVPHRLIDEFRLLVYPVVLGIGKRLFGEDSTSKLKLEEATGFKSGVALLRYTPASD